MEKSTTFDYFWLLFDVSTAAGQNCDGLGSQTVKVIVAKNDMKSNQGQRPIELNSSIMTSSLKMSASFQILLKVKGDNMPCLLFLR